MAYKSIQSDEEDSIPYAHDMSADEHSDHHESNSDSDSASM